MKKLSIFFLAYLLTNFAQSTELSTTNEFNVGVLYWSKNIPGQVAMRKGLEAQAEKINQEAGKSDLPKVNLIAQVAGDGEAGIENQIEQMFAFIKQPVDLIIVQPTDNAALSEALLAANQAKIPVVAYDQYIVKGKLTSFLTSDNEQAGYLNGEYVAAHFSSQQTIKIILVEYPHVSSTVKRVNGFLDALNHYQQPFEIIAHYEAIEPVGGKRVGKQILKDFPTPGSIDVIFAVNDGGGLSVVDALIEAGRDEIFVATADGDPKSVEYIKNGQLIRIDAGQFCGPLGAKTMEVAYAVLRGETVSPQISMQVFPITRETLDIYPGWMGPIPAPFEKPWTSDKPVWPE
jgi:ribose transport system substrate-binding protein